jgi:hypothetical protein
LQRGRLACSLADVPDRSKTIRWVVIALVAFGVVLAATLPCDVDDDAEDSETETVQIEPDRPERRLEASDTRLDGGLATRKIAEDCDPVTEAIIYEPFIDRRALAVLSWDGMRARAANLRIPVYVVGIEDGAVGIRFLPIPMRDQYLILWQQSGHIRRGPGESFLLDPCSATIEEWPEIERGEDYDLDEDLSDDEDVDP